MLKITKFQLTTLDDLKKTPKINFKKKTHTFFSFSKKWVILKEFQNTVPKFIFQKKDK